LTFNDIRYILDAVSIRGFRCPETQALFETGRSRRFRSIALVATRKLAQLDAAETLEFMRVPPGNRLEPLRGERAGTYSVRINDQFRLCFRWTDDGPDRVEIVDYH
jgi:proteic killer suppression protein